MANEVSKPDYSYQWSSGGALVAPSNVKIQTGWTAEVPPFQWENWSQNRQDNAILHLFQKGISEWDTLSNYYFTASGTRSYVQGSDGQIYVAVADSLNQNPVTDTSNTYWTKAFQDSIAAHGQCRLSFVSATSIRLSPINGNGLSIAGVRRSVPSAGVTLSNSGLSASTLYYIYASWNGTTIVLEASVTGHSADTTTGVEIKTGDATRTLVGMIYTTAASQFADSATSRLVASYFNRRSVGGNNDSTSTLNFSTTTATEISTTLRIQFLNWANEAVDIKSTGQMQVGLSQSVGIGVYVDAARYGNRSAMFSIQSAIGLSYASSAATTPAGAYLSEGFHTMTLYGDVTGSTGSFNFGTSSVITRI